MAQLTLEEKIQAAEYIVDTYLPKPGSGREPIPHLFVRDILGANTWSMQDEIVKSVFKYKTTAVKTCNAVGKSFIAARIVVSFLTLLPGSVVVTTAPTWRQVTDVLWREIAMTVKLSKYKLTDNEVRQAGLDIAKDWYAVGLSTKYPENFFGYHADHILVVVDEAGGVPEPIFRGVKAITPNANARILYIGNPTNPSGTFYDAFNNPKLPIKRFTVSAFQSPNFTANGVRDIQDLLALFTPPKGVDEMEHVAVVQAKLKYPYPALIDPATVYERYWEWGVDSPAWESLVMGEFPTQAEQALIPVDLVKMSMQMYGIDQDTGKTYAELSGWNIPTGPPEYGFDVARNGPDLNVLTPRRGGWVEEQIVWNKKLGGYVELDESADRILEIIDPLDFNLRLNLDDTALGGGVTATLNRVRREAMNSGKPAHQYQLVPYNMASKEFMIDPNRFNDITSELYWNLRTWFYKKQIALHEDKKLFDELVGRRWGVNKQNGKIMIEKKDDYKKRTGGRSPDRCLVAGTMILTNKGYRAIETIRKGDKVVTPYGTRTVLDAAMTNASAEVSTVKFSNGTIITGTSNHKMIVNGELRPIDSLTLGGKVYTDGLWNILKWRTQHLFSTKARHIGFRQQIEDITPRNYHERVASASENSYIEQSGKTPADGKSRRDTSFTILTTTLSIIALKISQLWRKQHTRAITWPYGLKSIKNKVMPYSIRSGRSLKRGTLLQKVENGIKRIAGKLGLTSRFTLSLADNAARLTSRHFQAEQSIAPTGVDKPSSQKQVTTRQQNESASTAGRILKRTDTILRNVVVENVVTDTERQAVYNLTVEKDNVYFANGILVSNSDSLAMAFAGGTRTGYTTLPRNGDAIERNQPVLRPMTSGVTQRF